jgi:glycosyltransferase involved in cell wall biosynthesis
MTADAVGGVWQYATTLAAELAQAGCEVSLAVMGPAPDAAQRAAAEGLAGIRLIETGLPLDWMCTSAAQARSAAQELSRLARTWDVDLVHCNSPALAGAAAFPVPVIAVAHGCITTWWDAARGGPVDPALHWHGDLTRRGLIAADAAVAPSASFATVLQTTYRLAHPPLVVRNGRAPAAHTGNDSEPMNAVMSAGRMWDPAKNAATLDRIAALVDLRVLAAGSLEGPQGERADFNHAVALGHVPGDDLAALFARRPIMVSTARFEPFGLAVLEAAAAGCALVLSDIPTFRELWEGAALFADPDDAGGFAAAIRQLGTDPGLRGTMGEAARTRAARYTPQASARAMLAIYRGVLASREVAA